MTTVQTLEVVITADTSALRRGFSETESMASGSASRMGGMMRTAVVGGALAAGAAIVGIGYEALQTAVTFETAFAQVEKTVGGSREQLDLLETQIRDMAIDTTNPLSALDNSAETLMNITALGGQLGIAKDNLDEFTQTVGLLTVATNLNDENAANLLARYSNVAGLDFSQFDEFADALVTLGNNSAAQEDEIAGFVNNLASLAQYDWDHTEIMGYAAAMASLGLGTEAGSTALRRMNQNLIEIANNPADLTHFTDTLGLAADEFADLVANDPAAAMDDFLEAYGRLSDAEKIDFREQFGLNDIRVTETLDKLSGGFDVVTRSVGLAEDAFAGNNAAMIEATALANTTAGQMARFDNLKTEALARLGEMLLPHVNEGLTLFNQVLGDLLNGEGIRSLDELVAGLAQNFANLVGVDVNIAEGWGDFLEVVQLGAKVFDIAIDRIARGLDVWIHDTRLRFIEFVNGFRQLVLDATGGQIDIAPDINFAYTDEQARLSAMDAVDQFTRGLNDQISQGEIDLSGLTIQNGDFSQLAVDSVTLDPQSLAFDPSTFGAEARYAIQDALRIAYEDGNLQDIETLTALALALNIDTNVVEQDMQAILGAQEFFAEVVANLRVAVNNVDTSDVVGAIGAAAAVAGNFLGNSLPQFAGGGMFNAPAGQTSGLALLHDGEQILTPAQQRNQGSSTTQNFYLTTYGNSPRQVAEMLRREVESQGF